MPVHKLTKKTADRSRTRAGKSGRRREFPQRPSKPLHDTAPRVCECDRTRQWHIGDGLCGKCGKPIKGV